MNPYVIGMALVLLPECPYFNEFFPDPTDVLDTEGEYISVKWESSAVPWDTIYLQQEDNKVFSVYVPPDSAFTELLLHRSAPEACPIKDNLLCLPLTGSSLPNSRASVWNLRAGICRDTAYLPQPKAGLSIIRTENNEWEISSKKTSNSNLTLDSIIAIYKEIPLYISEVAPCPEEDVPEWFEITNKTFVTFPLNGISDCETKTPLKTTDSIKGKSSILITKDSVGLKTFLKTEEIPVYQIPITALRNTNDTLRLCYNDIKLDSVMWGKATNNPVKCPNNDRITPGFIPKITNEKTRLIRLAEKVLVRSKRNTMLRLNINYQKPLEFRLIDRNGVGIVRKTLGVQELNSAWIEIEEWRYCQNGPCFIHLQGEEVDETAAFIVRP